jgi:hypothetical protein
MADGSRIKWYAVLTIGLVLATGGATMIATGADHGWPVTLFFGLATAVSVNQLWPGLLSGGSIPPEAILQRFPGPVELRVGKPKLLSLPIGAAIFGGVILWMLLHERFGRFETIALWLGVAGCAAAIPVMIVLVWRGSSLRLDGSGLQVRHGWRTRSTRWADASVFEVSAPIPPSDIRVVTYDDVTSRRGTVAAINARITGRGSALPDTYGLSLEELAWLLNHWRERALAVAAGKQQG